MRQYLFDLRKKLSLIQREVQDKVAKQFPDVPFRYGAIESGTDWSVITQKRAEMLAYAFDVSIEYILDKELTEGGYVGKHTYRSLSDKPNCLRVGNVLLRPEYDAPLTREEKAFAEEYYWYAKKIISILRCQEYRWALEQKLLEYEDFEEIGILGYLRAIKICFVKKVEEAEFMNSLDNEDYFYRWLISKQIKNAINKHVRSVLAVSRKTNINSIKFDKTLTDDSETDLYNFVPSKDLPVAIQGESSWMLHTLAMHLNDRQKNACRYLIAGCSSKELVSNRIASDKDVGIIKFYLIQIQKYGKIRWSADDYVSEAKGVTYDFTINKWHVKIFHKRRSYQLGDYSELMVAIDVQKLAEYHCVQNDFSEWYDKHMQANIYTGKAFTYPIGLASDEDELKLIGIEALNSKTRHSIESATLDAHVGIHWDARRNRWNANIGTKKLGSFKTLEEAVKVRNEAEHHRRFGDLDNWYAVYKQEREKQKFPRVRMYTIRKTLSYSYRVEHTYKGVTRRFGTYKDKEKAEAVVALANSHIDSDDFFKWADEYVANRRDQSEKTLSHNDSHISETLPAVSSASIKICKSAKGNSWDVFFGKERLNSFERRTLAEQFAYSAEQAIAGNRFDSFKLIFA